MIFEYRCMLVLAPATEVIRENGDVVLAWREVKWRETIETCLSWPCTYARKGKGTMWLVAKGRGHSDPPTIISEGPEEGLRDQILWWCRLMSDFLGQSASVQAEREPSCRESRLKLYIFESESGPTKMFRQSAGPKANCHPILSFQRCPSPVALTEPLSKAKPHFVLDALSLPNYSLAAVQSRGLNVLIAF